MRVSVVRKGTGDIGEDIHTKDRESAGKCLVSGPTITITTHLGLYAVPKDSDSTVRIYSRCLQSLQSKVTIYNLYNHKIHTHIFYPYLSLRLGSYEM